MTKAYPKPWIVYTLSLYLPLSLATDSGDSAVETCPIELKPHTGDSNVDAPIEKHVMALMLLLGFGGFSLIIAFLYKALRKHVFHDEYKLDTVFDAGGRVSLSLTAVTVTSQLFFPADFLQNSTIITKSGLGGSLWNAVAVVIAIVSFPPLSIYLKTRAPGAKTFPQIAYARFGKLAHIIFCIYALMTNVIISMSVLLSGRAVIQVLCKDSNSEFVMLILSVLFGSYCIVGGLGTTFYISYFNTALTFASISVYILSTSFFPSDENAAISSRRATYDAVSCLVGPEGNYERSFLTFRTRSGMIYGVVILFMASALSFCDQANWQSRMAAKPSQGVIGFFFAAYMWFVVPTALSFTAAMSYYSMSFKNGTHLLSALEIDDGYIPPFVMESLLGPVGGYLLTAMVMMAAMSTGSGEVMSISSIIVYDIYKTYINPFRKYLTPTSCILCGKERVLSGIMLKSREMCSCPSTIGCKPCLDDINARSKSRSIRNVHYTCEVHGQYRHYEDDLMQQKNWCMVAVVICKVPFGLLISETGMNVFWATIAIPVFTTPFLPPLFLTVMWAKATSKGVVAGSVIGLISSIAGMLIMGSTYEGGLGDFYVNTSQDYSLLCAMAAGFVVSAASGIIVSLLTTDIKTEEEKSAEWDKTINIDNPLNPFRLVYKEELDAIAAGPVITAKVMEKLFRKSKFIAIIGAVISLVIFLVILPAIALSFDILTYEQFSAWLTFFQVWVFVGLVLVVVLPPIEEGLQIWRKYQENKAMIDKQNLVTEEPFTVNEEEVLCDKETESAF